MKGKILIGSIAAVVIMILASCSTVVGAENVKEGLEVEEKNVEKIEQMVESLKEKMNMDETNDAESTIWFPGQIIVTIGILIWILIIGIICEIFNIPGPAMPW